MYCICCLLCGRTCDNSQSTAGASAPFLMLHCICCLLCGRTCDNSQSTAGASEQNAFQPEKSPFSLQIQPFMPPLTSFAESTALSCLSMKKALEETKNQIKVCWCGLLHQLIGEQVMQMMQAPFYMTLRFRSSRKILSSWQWDILQELVGAFCTKCFPSSQEKLASAPVHLSC